MRRIFVFVLCTFLLFATSVGVAQDEMKLIDHRRATELLGEINDAVEVIGGYELDSDTQEILSFGSYQLSLITAGLTITLPEEEQLHDYDQFSLEENEEEYSEEIYRVEPTYISEIGCGQGYMLYKKENYTRVESTVYDPELRGKQEFVRIEYATRLETEEKMILLTLLKYDDIMTSANRYLVYSDGSAVKSLYRRTFGSDTEYRVDLALWAEGQNYEWDEKLLYPKK